MKRDMDLVREILLELEQGALPDDLKEIDGYSEQEIIYHVKIMNDFGLIDIEVVEVASRTTGMKAEYSLGRVEGITWEGYEFLDTARNQEVWNKAKDKATHEGVTMPFKIMQGLLENMLRSMLMPGV